MMARRLVGASPRARSIATSAAAGALLVGLLAPAATAQSPQDGTVGTAAHGIEAACREGVRTAAPFDDVNPEGAHGEAISCLWAYGIVSGRFIAGEQRFSPTSTVTREQTATFVSTALEQVTDDVYALPEGDTDLPYEDAEEISEAHGFHVGRLTEAGLIRGYGDDTFRPMLPVSREQMATFIVTAIEAVTGEDLPREAAFDDIADTHRANIEKLAAIGVATGTSEGVFSPRAPVTRQQLASFVARALDHLATEGALRPLSYDPGSGPAILGLVDVDVAAHDGYDRVTFTIGGDGEAGWRVGYVDEATSAGSGDVVEVDGDAVLQVSLTGMGYPTDLPPEVRDDLWPEEGEAGEVVFGGDGIVEVIDDTVFEGQQELFIGTTGLRPFEVNRLEDPQRIYIDVQHAS